MALDCTSISMTNIDWTVRAPSKTKVYYTSLKHLPLIPHLAMDLLKMSAFILWIKYFPKPMDELHQGPSRVGLGLA